jgi:DNA repair protein RecO (recombination protein O)
MIVYRRENKDIQQLKEIKIAFPLKSIPFDIRKSSVIVFLNEILNNVINEEEPNPDLFDFLYNSIQTLDNMEKGVAGFHLLFLIRLSRHLGFFPNNNYSDQEPVFNLQEGNFTHQQLPESHGISLPYSTYFSLMITHSTVEEADVHLSAGVRSVLLESILRYYYFHVSGMKGIKSHHVLQTVLND